MAADGFTGLALGAVGLGIVHGVEPGHGWPVAATYALDRSNKWLAGLAASTVLGVGHLVSSIAMVVVFFWAKAYFDLTQIGWMNAVAGVLLLLLGLREYRLYRRGEGHSHGADGGHDRGLDGGPEQESGVAEASPRPGKFDVGIGDHGHDHAHGGDQSHGNDHGKSDDHTHGQAHGHAYGPDHGHSHDDPSGVIGRILALLPVDLVPDQPAPSEASDRGILGIAAFAFALGFAHEEEFEIIALCLGSDYCLELMLVYALTVVAAIVAFTLLLVAGYEHYEERVENYAPYLPLFSASVLVLMGVGFLLGLF